mmetsp:Transcript_7766/g.14767  ORF Transcript_7766/g.14767 Transcript_7766/m.14767 type:complete len:121 (+) Transcript_7766:277-639(+)
MVSINSYLAFHATKFRFGSCTKQYGPMLMCFLASILVLMDPTRIVFYDMGVWTGPSSDVFSSTCVPYEETARCLTLTGVLFTYVGTYLGFGLLMISTLWNGDIINKVKDVVRKWNELRKE